MANLNLRQQSDFQSQPSKPEQGSAAPISAEAPLAAPMPTRSNVQPPAVSSPNIWNPAMGINFAGNQPRASPGNLTTPPTSSQSKKGQWDPSKGLQFK
jgi:hypothetical protein